ncbi:hypothetical protein B0E38_01805 [Streptomyces sp. 111WW2]|uniref:hypothetical protein n=1 Tax=Streptomyces sp. 111WW2 TaxID=1945515 RepID=UPI000D2E7BE0|nr:hypothetical protein [Streptomyces sp. 111WW2]PSK57960.1 hypothetical protein B0E38_01805 [Streptomyces sp. 111WW2]
MARKTYPRTEHVPLDQLTLYPGNAKNGDVDEILNSLRISGQYKPLTVREHDDGGTLTVLAGNNTLKAMRKHGPKPCGVTVKVDGEERPCALCGDGKWKGTARCEIDQYDDRAAVRVNIADNKLAELGVYDDEALVKLLEDLDSLDGTGWTDNDLDELLQTTGALADESTSFLAEFSAPEQPAPAPPASAGAPALNPFSDPTTPAPAPATPAPTAAPADPLAGPATADSAPAPATAPPAYGDGVHTGPDAYQGPGAPASAGVGAQLPPPVTTVPLQWVVTLPQRDTIRAAIKHAQTAGELDSLAAGLTAVCQHYLTAVGTEADG